MMAAKFIPETRTQVGKISTAWTHMMNQATLLTVLAPIANAEKSYKDKK